MEIGFVPWLIAGLTAAWFCWMASRAGRNPTLWGVGGAAFGLVTSTIVLGLGQAVSIPFSDHERTMDRIEWTAVAAALVASVGWVLTSSLHRHHLTLWRRIRSSPGQNQLASGDPRSGGEAPTKQPAGRTPN